MSMSGILIILMVHRLYSLLSVSFFLGISARSTSALWSSTDSYLGGKVEGQSQEEEMWCGRLIVLERRGTTLLSWLVLLDERGENGSRRESGKTNKLYRFSSGFAAVSRRAW
jgi:hypothetical protein